MLNGARLAQIAHHGPLVRALLDAAVELRERNYRAFEFTGQHLQTPRDFAQLGGAVFAVAAVAAHELQIVDHDQAELSALARQAPRAGAQIARGKARALVNVQ